MTDFSKRLMRLVHNLEARAISACDIELVDGEVLRLRFGSLEQDSESVSAFDVPALEHQVGSPSAKVIRSDGMGHFFRQYPLGEPTDSLVAESVSAGDVVGYLLAGEIVQPVVSPYAGRLSASLISDGELVGYGDELYSLEPVV